MTAEVASVALGIPHTLIPLWIQELLEAVRNLSIIIGVVVIPIVIWREGKKREIRRVTLDVVRTLATDPLLHDRAKRVYQHLKSEGQDPQATSPYANRLELSLLHDCAMLLNFFDVICIELQHGLLNEDILYETSSPIFLSAHDDVLQEFNKVRGRDMTGKFPHLVDTCKKWRAKTG